MIAAVCIKDGGTRVLSRLLPKNVYAVYAPDPSFESMLYNSDMKYICPLQK